MKFISLGFLLFFISFNCVADVYTETDTHGNIIFSDSPLSDKAKKLSTTELNQTSTIQSGSSQAEQNTSPSFPTGKIAINKPYNQFAIISPVDQATFQNQTIIPVSIKTDPSLQSGDKIQIYLDGAPWGGANNTTNFDFPRPDRGTHLISAKLIDNNQHILKDSNTVTVFIHQSNIPHSPIPAINNGFRE